MKRSASQAQLVTIQPMKKARRNSAPRPKRFTDELKYTVYVSAPTGVSWSGSTDSLFGNMTRGDSGKNNYDGDSWSPKSVTLRMQMVPQNSTDMLRVIVLQVLKGTAPTAAQLLDTTGSISAPLSSFNRPYKRLVKILADRLYRLSNTEFGNYTDEIYIKSKRLKPVEVLTSAQTVVTGDIRVYYYSQISAAGPTLSYVGEVTYTD